MAIRVGDTYVSETAYAQAKANIENEQKGGSTSVNSYLKNLQQKMDGWDISTNTQPFGGSGVRNIGIHPSILRQMANDPEKRLEYEALLIDVKNVSENMRLPKGMKLIAQGFNIDAKGGLSSWSITQTEGGNAAKATSKLPKDKKEDWNDVLLERLLEKQSNPYEDSNGLYLKA
jgi:hypothetical protein